jgi:hypothetical protein
MSPFLPPSNGGPVAAAPEATPFELHGVMTTPEGTRFSIFNVTRKSSSWVMLNQPGPDYTVKAHRLVDGNDQVTIDYQGNSYTLALKSSKISAAPSAPMGQPMPTVAAINPAAINPAANPANQSRPVQFGQPPGARGPGPTATPMAPEQLAQLEQMIAENRRRRENLQRQTQPVQTAPASNPAGTRTPGATETQRPRKQR